jgi:hypothetical protein
MIRNLRELSSYLGGISSRDVPAQLSEPVLIRYSRDDDRAALERLAALDSRKLAGDAFLLAEVEGELVAAAPLDLDQEPLSDPFRPTASIRRLLRLQARQIRRSQARRPLAKARRVLREVT